MSDARDADNASKELTETSLFVFSERELAECDAAEEIVVVEDLRAIAAPRLITFRDVLRDHYWFEAPGHVVRKQDVNEHRLSNPRWPCNQAEMMLLKQVFGAFQALVWCPNLELALGTFDNATCARRYAAINNGFEYLGA